MYVFIFIPYLTPWTSVWASPPQFTAYTTSPIARTPVSRSTMETRHEYRRGHIVLVRQGTSSNEGYPAKAVEPATDLISATLVHLSVWFLTTWTRSGTLSLNLAAFSPRPLGVCQQNRADHWRRRAGFNTVTEALTPLRKLKLSMRFSLSSPPVIHS